ncbi:MAG: peptide ABC transporter substrate-binding protein [Patescibacteria group bacterium]
MKSLRAFLSALLKRRDFRYTRALEAKASVLTPSDWLVVGVLGTVMAFTVASMLASISLSLALEVPAHGGTYTEGLAESPRFINPLLAVSDTDRDLTTLVFSGLLRANPDGTLSPDIASAYTISDDKLTYTFTISDAARFHDGTRVTAEDVAYTVRTAENPDMKSPRRADWEGVTVTVIDPKTVSFTLKSPYAPFIENMTLGILPKHIWQDVTPEEFPFSTINADPIGSGPYRVSSLKRNNSGIPIEYHLKAVSEGTRVPFIENFVFKIYANDDELKAALTKGEVGAAHSIDTTSLVGAHTVNEAVFGRVFSVFFNQSQNKIFAETAVRQALDAAVDKQALVSTVLGGHGAVIDGPLPPDSVTKSQTDSRSTDDRLAGARAILAKAGWKAGSDGILTKTVGSGKKKETLRLAFSLSTSNVPELKRTAEMVADDWRALGAEIELKFFDQNDLNVGVIRPRKYDALIFGLVIGRELDLFAFWHSSQRNDPGLNIALYVNNATDKKLEGLRTEQDQGNRLQKARDIANDITKDAAAVFLYTPYFVYVTPQALSGMHLGTILTPSDRFNAADTWYLRTERVWPIFTKKH